MRTIIERGLSIIRPVRAVALALQLSKGATCLMTKPTSNGDLYRRDGVRITHDPFSPGMGEKYGFPGETDREGFDPYADSVGAGIYGGIVARDPQSGEVVVGRQYQNHNPRPGPTYAGGGYASSTRALDEVDKKLIPLLGKYPDLVNDVTTGGASPLHMCGMSRNKQHAVRALVERGADIEALDTYGMTPLHRMASNNLAAGAAMLLKAGADVTNEGNIGETALSIARSSAAYAAMEILEKAEGKSSPGTKDNVVKVNVMGSEIVSEVNGDYAPKNHTAIPSGFSQVCQNQGWDTTSMWAKLNGVSVWFAHSENESYIYWNKNDRKWWIDGPNGNGVWIVEGPSHAPPAHGWMHVLKGATRGVPMVRSFRDISGEKSAD